VVYINTETNEPVNEFAFGRCDREAECGYHNKPQVEKKKDQEDAVLHQIFPDDALTKTFKRAETGLHTFLKTKGIEPKKLYELGIVEDKGLTVYIFKNQFGKIVNFKWFKYKPDGHRDHDFQSFSLKQPEQTNKYVKDYYSLSLFLEQFLDPERKKIVCIVESEKTAGICKITYPEFDWVACGSASGLSDGSEGTTDKITPLKGREVYWISDADKAGRGEYKEKIKGNPDSKEWVWPSSVRNLIKHIDKVHVVDLFPGRSDGYDLGDDVLAGNRPAIVPTWTKGKQSAELYDKRENSIVEINEDDLIYEFRNGKPIGEDGRIQDMKNNFSWKSGFVNCWTGWPNDGKSTFFMFMALMKSIVDDWVWLIWPPEMLNTVKDSKGRIKTSASDIIDELVFMMTGKSPYLHYIKLYGIPQMNEHEYLESVRFIKKHFIIIHPKDKKYTDLIDNCYYFYEKFNVRGFLIDPFKNIDHNDNDARFDLYLDKVFAASKECSLQTDTSFNYIAHPKAQADPMKPDGSFKICSQFMLSGGASWNNNMDGIYSIYRQFKHKSITDPRVTFLNMKQRKQSLVGRVGSYDKIEFIFNTSRYYFDGYCPIDGTYVQPMAKKEEAKKMEEKSKEQPAQKTKKGKVSEPSIPFSDIPLPEAQDEHDTIF
jgi:hypothetical protein